MLDRRTLLGAMSIAAASVSSASATAYGADPPKGLRSGARVPAVQFIYECTVKLGPIEQFGRGTANEVLIRAFQIV